MVHLGRNPITAKGWEAFKNFFMDDDSAGIKPLCILPRTTNLKITYSVRLALLSPISIFILKVVLHLLIYL